ncbi:DUF4184 family protein [Marinisporobacter balticus]|uniref:Uncharacterized protein DUF4184 n=1 Tax=Marinisporobacter balticus TaxID=2018667 RepID=A0A4R2L2Q2_9FIRM|nr:DUF4184 family protein [Marinisporobacter balticus]TCO78046.1 uncharacterized protein DUF4184 [Marinisporobacter balticus]
MPFTFAHPAIIIPFKKWEKYFNITALIIGSMAPDFEYFLRFKPMGEIGHTFLGFFYFNLPLCFIIAHVFHFVVKKPFLLNMPKPIERWFYVVAFEQWRIKDLSALVVFIYSSLIGMVSHVVWDSFTHRGGFFVTKIPLLSKYIPFMHYEIPIYKFLQHSSTLIGFAIIFSYLYVNRNLYKRMRRLISSKIKWIYWCFSLFIAIAIVYYRIYFVLGGFNLNYLGSHIVSVINGGIIGVTVTSLIFNILFKYE